MMEEILLLMDEQRQMKHSTKRYKALNKEIRRKCLEAKDKFLNGMYVELEQL